MIRRLPLPLAMCALAVVALAIPAIPVAAESAGRGDERDSVHPRTHGGWFEHLREMALPYSGRGRLGVQVQAMTPELREFMGGPADRGILVARVDAGSPAEVAGIRVGDIIVAADGEDVEAAHDLIRTVHHTEPGSAVALEIVRDQKTRVVDVTPDEPEIARHECDSGDCPHARPFGLPFPAGRGELGERLDEIEKRLEELEKHVLPDNGGAERAT